MGVTSAPRPRYPGGLLVTQDGYNVDSPENRNFKLVSRRSAVERLGLC